MIHLEEVCISLERVDLLYEVMGTKRRVKINRLSAIYFVYFDKLNYNRVACLKYLPFSVGVNCAELLNHMYNKLSKIRIHASYTLSVRIPECVMH